jgi:hypothetical protein
MTGGGKVSGFGGRVMDETTEERVLEDISVGAEELVVELETVPDVLVLDEDGDWEELDSEGEEDVGPDDEHLIADEELLDVDELLWDVLVLELIPDIELGPELDREDVGGAKVVVGDDAGDAFEELDVEVSLEVELDDEEELSVVVDRKTPL